MLKVTTEATYVVEDQHREVDEFMTLESNVEKINAVSQQLR